MKDARLSDKAATWLRVILYLPVGALVLFLIAGIHGDGWVKPKVRVQVNGPDGAPIEEATVIFFDREGQRDTWLYLREESLSMEDCVPEHSIGATNGSGQAEIQGSFAAAFYLYHTYVGGRAILRVERFGYLPTEVVVDSRERREEILNELVELDVTLQEADSGQPHER